MNGIDDRDAAHRRTLLESLLAPASRRHGGDRDDAADGNDLRARLQALVRVAAREAFHLSDQAEDFSPLKDYLSDMFGEKNGGFTEDLTGKKAMDSRNLADQLFPTCGHRLTRDEIEEVSAALAEADGKQGAVLQSTLREYLSFKSRGPFPSQLGVVAARIQRRMAAQVHANSLDFEGALCERGERGMSAGKLHAFVLNEPGLGYDLTGSEVAALMVRIANDGSDSDGGGGGVCSYAAFMRFVEGTHGDAAASVNGSGAAKGGAGSAAADFLGGGILDLQVSTTAGEGDEWAQYKYKQLQVTARTSLWYLPAGGPSRLMPITSVLLDPSCSNSSLAVSGYTCLRTNLGASAVNVTSRGLYLWIKRASNAQQGRDEAIVDLALTTGRERDLRDAIHMPPDKAARSPWHLVPGNLSAGLFSTDAFLWCRHRTGAKKDARAGVEYIRWSPERRRLEAEAALKRAVRQFMTQRDHERGAAAAPEPALLFNVFDGRQNGRLTRTQFFRMLEAVGLALEPAERELLLRRMDHAGTAEVRREEFVTFCQLTEYEIDKIGEELKGHIRLRRGLAGGQDARAKRKAVARVTDLLKDVAAHGGPTLSLDEMEHMLGLMHVFLTKGELRRLVASFEGGLDGEVHCDALRNFVVNDAHRHHGVRRSAARVLRAAGELRGFILDQRKNTPLRMCLGMGRAPTQRANDEVESRSAWAVLVAASARRRASASTLSRNLPKAPALFSAPAAERLELEDLSMAVERKPEAPRLAHREARRLMMLIAPSGDKDGRVLGGAVQRDDFDAFAASPVRPIALLLRVLDGGVLRQCGDLVAKYRAHYNDPRNGALQAAYTQALLEAMRTMRFLDDRGNPKLVTVGRLEQSMTDVSSGADAPHASGGDAVADMTQAEWVACVLHTGADVLESGADEEEVHLVHTRRLLEGLCRIRVGDVFDTAGAAANGGAGSAEAAGAAADARLYTVCLDLQRDMETEGPHVGDDEPASARYSAWLKNALVDAGLPSTYPCPVATFATLLRRLGEDKKWALASGKYKEWANAVDSDGDGYVRTAELSAFAAGEAGWLSGGRHGGGYEAAGGEGGGVSAAFSSGDADADRLVLAVVEQLKAARGASAEAVAEALNRGFLRFDPPPQRGTVTRNDFYRALVAAGASRLELSDVQPALPHFSERGGSGGGAYAAGAQVEYMRFTAAARRAYLSVRAADGSVTGSLRLDLKLNKLQRELREASAVKTRSGKATFAPLQVFARLDADGDGKITPQELCGGLKELGLATALTLADAKKIVEFFDDDGQGVVDHEEFYDLLMHGTLGQKKRLASRTHRDGGGGGFGSDEDDDDWMLTGKKKSPRVGIYEKVAAALEDRWSAPEDRERLKNWLRRKDVGGDGQVSERNFRQFLDKARIADSLTQRDVDDLLQELDPDATHWVAYSRFCKRVIDGVGGGGSGGGLSASLDREFGGLGKSGGGGAEAALGALQKTIDAAAMSAARGRPFHAVFRAYDENGTGLVGREDAQAALRQLHADLNATELQLVVDRLPPRADRRVDYNALYAELLRTTPRGAGLGLGGTAGSVALPAPATPLVDLRGSGGFAPMSVGGLGMMGGGMGGGGGGMAMGAMGGVNDNLLPNISRRVRSTVRQQQGQWGPQFTLARLFEGYDPVGRGTVTSQQFQTVLAQLGLPLAAVEVAQLQRRFDRFGDGTGFDYRDFARFVELDGNELSVVLGNVAAKLAEVRRRGVDVRLAFAMNDIGETGFISGRDFREASRQLTLPMTEAHLQLVTSKYSALGNPNLVSYDEFLRAANGAMPALDLDGGGSVFGSARRDSRGLGTVAGGGYDGFSSGGAYRAREGRGSRDLDDGGFGGGRASARRGFDSAGGRAPRFGDSGARGTPYGGRKSASYDDHESAFGDEARSPVRQLGVKMYGAGTPLRDRGSLPPSGRGFASGHWTCVVCLCSDNVGPECEICNAPNPSSKHAVVTQQCPGCSFQNTDSAVECAMCGERMADIRRGRGGGGGAGGSAKIAAWRDDHDSDGDSYDVRRPSRRD